MAQQNNGKGSNRKYHATRNPAPVESEEERNWARLQMYRIVAENYWHDGVSVRRSRSMVASSATEAEAFYWALRLARSYNGDGITYYEVYHRGRKVVR